MSNNRNARDASIKLDDSQKDKQPKEQAKIDEKDKEVNRPDGQKWTLSGTKRSVAGSAGYADDFQADDPPKNQGFAHDPMTAVPTPPQPSGQSAPRASHKEEPVVETLA
ncbi:hypothetical protein FRB99_002301 [Tulasnella sp. 403]|nr:hypothetical protein FRB99_002301 [Tulasnella sp. 403]